MLEYWGDQGGGGGGVEICSLVEIADLFVPNYHAHNVLRSSVATKSGSFDD